MRHKRFTPFGAVAIAVVLSAWSTSRAAAQDLYAALGSSLYSDDPFCLSTSAALSTAQIGVGGDAIGVSASYNNSNWPWPKPPPPPPGGLVVPGAHFSLASGQQQEAFFQTHGDAFRAVLELFPLGFVPGLRESTVNVRRYIKPFLGVGVQVSTDGEAAAAGVNGPQPTYAVLGSTDLLLAYGASATVPLNDRLGIHLQFRGNTLFAGDIELEGPNGETLISEDNRLNWGEWLVGLNLRF
jgi:hypothetical protein